MPSKKSFFHRWLQKLKGKSKVQTNEVDNPWIAPKKPTAKDKDSFKYFMRGTFESWSSRIQNSFNAVWRSTIYKRVFLKIKRICFGCLFLFYIGLALAGHSNPLFLVLCLITAYAFLENLIWARHYQWKKNRKEENEN